MCSSVQTSRGSQVVKHVGRLIGLLAVNLNLEHVVQFVFVHENLRKRGASLLWHASWVSAVLGCPRNCIMCSMQIVTREYIQIDKCMCMYVCIHTCIHTYVHT